MTVQFQSLIYKKKEHHCIIKLNRPDALNSIDSTMRKELVSVFNDFKMDNNMRVAILTGMGERAFCAGSDLKNTMPPETSFAEEYLHVNNQLSFIESLKGLKPIICAINGYAIGGGLELALACDIRIASKNASFGLAEVKVATIPGAGGTQRLPRAIPQAIAMKMLLTGERIDAEEAYRIGLISDLVEQEELLSTAEKIASSIIQNGPLAVKVVKQLVLEGQDMALNSALMAERLMWGNLRETEDWVEGRKAFSEKRKPQYKGK